MTSAVLSDTSVPAPSSLDSGRGMGRKLSILTWGFPLRKLRPVSL